MKNKDKKLLQTNLAKENIEHFFNLLETRFNPEFDSKYIKEIQNLSTSFNIRLTREQKLKFCKKCLCFWNVNTREIRLNPTFNTKEYICKNCSAVRRFKYKD